jgi:hypothetical protein
MPMRPAPPGVRFHIHRILEDVMAHVTVADDVLTGQPDASMQPDLAAPEPDPETWVIDMWYSDVRFLITPASDSVDAESPEGLASGVRRAVSCLWLVDEAGEEIPADDPFHDLRTPDASSAPSGSDRHRRLCWHSGWGPLAAFSRTCMAVCGPRPAGSAATSGL